MQTATNYQSTKPIIYPDQDNIGMTAIHSQINTIYIRSIAATRLLWDTDQIGAFPVPSNCSNHYIVVTHHFITNAILVCHMPSQSQQHLHHAFHSIYETLCDAEYEPTDV